MLMFLSFYRWFSQIWMADVAKTWLLIMVIGRRTDGGEYRGALWSRLVGFDVIGPKS